MAVVYLLRHGQASFGAEDYDVLSPTGSLQAKVLGDELRRRGPRVDAVWSGTLRRQLATAAVCLPAAGVEVDVREDPRWNEYDHLGLVPEGQAEDPADLVVSARRFQARLDAALTRWLAGEGGAGASGSWAEFSGGAFSALTEALAALPKGGTGLVFTSAGLISAICARVLNLPPEGFLALNRTMANAGITKLVSGRSGVSLVSYNEHGHFEGENRSLLTYR